MATPLDAQARGLTLITSSRTTKGGGAAMRDAGMNSGSRIDEDNSFYVALFFIGLAAVAVVTGHLNVRIGK